MYASSPLEWPLMDKGIAYWIDRTSNVRISYLFLREFQFLICDLLNFQSQIHLLGNISIWYSGTAALFTYFGLFIFYSLRRHRLCYDISDAAWNHFVSTGSICFFGYLFNFVPYFLVDKPMFLHNYLPALLFKIMLLTFVVEHLNTVFGDLKLRFVSIVFRVLLALWMLSILYVFVKFSTLSYGKSIVSDGLVTSEKIVELQWKNTWDFILHTEL